MPEKNTPGGARGKVENDDIADWSDAWALFPGDVAYVWHAGNKAHIVAESLLASALEIRAQIVWAKSQHVISRGHYHPQHEPCWYAVRKGATGHWHGDRKQTTLWSIPKPQKSETGHSTQKPIECMKRPIENNSAPGDLVYEPFSGSGTTIIAAEMTGRKCRAIELNPAYVDIAVRRWQDFTGKLATLEGDGRTFEQVKADRVGEAAHGE
jgi:DNA modification methylase